MSTPRLIYRIISNRNKILEIAERHGVENIRIFGSVARKQENSDSDIDLLVDVTTKPDGTKGNYIDFALEVRKIYKKRRIDVCTSDGLHPRFRDKVLTKCISIMEDDPQIDREEVDERDYAINVEKSQEAIKNFWRIIKTAGKEKFISDRDTQSSASREMQIAVEEIVRTIPDEIKVQIEDVDWRELKEFRNFIVHHYDDVEWDAMWETAQRKIKETEYACERVLEVLGEKK